MKRLSEQNCHRQQPCHAKYLHIDPWMLILLRILRFDIHPSRALLMQKYFLLLWLRKRWQRLIWNGRGFWIMLVFFTSFISYFLKITRFCPMYDFTYSMAKEPLKYCCSTIPTFINLFDVRSSLNIKKSYESRKFLSQKL